MTWLLVAALAVLAGVLAWRLVAATREAAARRAAETRERADQGARLAALESRATAAESASATSEHALAASRAEAEQAKAMLDALPFPVWRRGADLAIADCNRAFARALETTREQALADGRMLGAAELVARTRDLARLARTAGAAQSEAHHVVIAGARRLIEITEAPFAEGGVGVALDTTEREEASAELERHVAAHGEVLENLATAIAIFDAEARLSFFNTAFAKLWKLDAAWLRTRPDYGQVLEDLRERRRLPEYADFPAFKRLRLKLFTTLIEPLEELIYIPDGTTLRTRTMPHPMGGLLFTYEDVTDVLALERSYNTLIAVQRETLDHLYEGVAVVGGDGRLKLTNPAFARMWQVPAEALSAEPHIAELVERTRGFYDDGVEWPGFKEKLIARLTDRMPLAGRLARRDGTVLDFASVPLPDGATLLSYLDVTDSTRVESALRERAEALEAADRLKSEFISNVSYELRTPLNTIIGFAEILANQYFGKLDERQLEYCSGIIVSSQRLLAIINDILDLASIEAGRLSLERDNVQPRALLENVAGIMNEWSRKQNLKLAVSCPPTTPAIEIDERRMKQALCNLVSNAIKFTPSGGSITLAYDTKGGDAVLSVVDTGVGIAREDQDRVFKEFERGRSSEAKRLGAGLGLSLVKRIVELHGGHVAIDSVPGRGTTVTCVVPAHPTLVPPAQAAD